MASPSLSTGMILSPSSAVPPPLEAAATTMERNDEQAPANMHAPQMQLFPHQISHTNSGTSSTSATNGNHGSLAAATGAGTAVSGGTPTPAAGTATVAGSAKKKKECDTEML